MSKVFEHIICQTINREVRYSTGKKIYILASIFYFIFVRWFVQFSHSSVRVLLTLCKYGGSLGRPGSSCAKARLVRPREFCFDCASQRFSQSIWFPSSCYVLKSHQRGDLTPAETKIIFALPRFFTKKEMDSSGSTRRIRRHFSITELKERNCARFTSEEKTHETIGMGE